jgi:hypothetical protein
MATAADELRLKLSNIINQYGPGNVTLDQCATLSAELAKIIVSPAKYNVINLSKTLRTIKGVG